jgi:hypothetical protein
LLDRADPSDRVGQSPAPSAGDVEHRIADELTGSVVGDVAATIGGHHRSADRRRIDQHIGRIGVHAERVHVGVFQQEEPVAPTLVEQGTLDHRRFIIGNGSEPTDVQRRR